MEDTYVKNFKRIIEFMWKEHKIPILIDGQNEISHIYGCFGIEKSKGRERKQAILLNIANINERIKDEKNRNIIKLQVLLHEIGHFLLEKARYAQREEYADFLSLKIASNILEEKDFRAFYMICIFKVNWVDILKIESNYKEELQDISTLFCYQYKKYLMKEEGCEELL